MFFIVNEFFLPIILFIYTKGSIPQNRDFRCDFYGKNQGSSAIKGLMRQGFTSAMVLVNML